MLGFAHPLTSLGFIPRLVSNNMDGFNGASSLYDHLAMYWFAFGLLLTVLSFKIWNRGVVANFTVKLKQLISGWTTIQKATFSLCMLMFIGAGSLVFYNVNIVSGYETMNDRLDFSENYERKFKKHDNLERLVRTSMKTEVAIYPKERMYTVKADYVLKSKSERPLSELFITERIPLESITIENARLVTHDAFYGTYLFQFDKPLQLNDSVSYKYELKKELKGYEEDNSIVNNGTYINRFANFEPRLSYNSGFEITSKIERQERNLPERIIEGNNSDAHIVLDDIKFQKVSFETIISTSSDQTAISSGRLIKEWSDNDRNYYHYKSSDKILPAVGYFSANYTSKKVNYKGVSIEQYYDANHDFNIEDMENSVKQTLDYCQENFGVYAFDHVRIAEVPSYWPFGGFAHPGVISMVEDRLYLSDVSNEETFNVVAKRTIHEVAHQWWGHTLNAKPVPGGSLFLEGFAKIHKEAVVMEKMYGKGTFISIDRNC